MSLRYSKLPSHRLSLWKIYSQPVNGGDMRKYGFLNEGINGEKQVDQSTIASQSINSPYVANERVHFHVELSE